MPKIVVEIEWYNPVSGWLMAHDIKRALSSYLGSAIPSYGIEVREIDIESLIAGRESDRELDSEPPDREPD